MGISGKNGKGNIKPFPEICEMTPWKKFFRSNESANDISSHRTRARDKIWEGGPPLGGWGLISKPAGKIGHQTPFFKRLFAES
jgi:hypothetical protein